jgi:hypothetical protein
MTAGGDDWDAAIAQHINDKHLKPAVRLLHGTFGMSQCCLAE